MVGPSRHGPRRRTGNGASSDAAGHRASGWPIATARPDSNGLVAHLVTTAERTEYSVAPADPTGLRGGSVMLAHDHEIYGRGPSASALIWPAATRDLVVGSANRIADGLDWTDAAGGGSVNGPGAWYPAVADQLVASTCLGRAPGGGRQRSSMRSMKPRRAAAEDRPDLRVVPGDAIGARLERADLALGRHPSATVTAYQTGTSMTTNPSTPSRIISMTAPVVRTTIPSRKTNAATIARRR